MSFVKIWTLIAVPFFCGLGFHSLRNSICATTIILTVIALIGKFWSWAQTDFGLQPPIYGLSILFLIYIWAIKKVFFPTVNIEVGKWNVLKNGIQPLFKPETFLTHFVIFGYFMINVVVCTAYVVLVHWFTMWSHTNFLISFSAANCVLILLVSLSTLIMYQWERYKGTDSVLSDRITFWHCIFICMQFLLFFLSVLLAYWVFYKIIKFSQIESILIGSCLFPSVHLLLYVVSLGLSKKRDPEKFEELEEELETFSD